MAQIPGGTPVACWGGAWLRFLGERPLPAGVGRGSDSWGNSESPENENRGESIFLGRTPAGRRRLRLAGVFFG